MLKQACLLCLIALPAAATEPGLLPYKDAEAVELGRDLYADHCASCHGDRLQGEPNWRVTKDNGMRAAPPHDETGHTWHHADELLFDLTKRGVAEVVGRGYESEMIGFGDILTDAEILAVLGFIKSTWPEDVIATHNKFNSKE